MAAWLFVLGAVVVLLVILFFAAQKASEDEDTDNDDSGNTTNYYSCKQGRCELDSNSTLTLANCVERCNNSKYTCDEVEGCIPDESGRYSSYSECTSDCDSDSYTPIYGEYDSTQLHTGQSISPNTTLDIVTNTPEYMCHEVCLENRECQSFDVIRGRNGNPVCRISSSSESVPYRKMNGTSVFYNMEN